MQCKTNAKSVYVHRLLDMLETTLNREEETSISVCNELIKVAVYNLKKKVETGR